jgi:1-acyl-sn-glycerol-3-phosphate acyltransferase
MFLHFLYYFFKVLCASSVKLYYRITFFDRKNFDLPSGACIMTSNHPNTLIDAIITVAFVNRKSHFLANASLFKHPIMDWIWRKLWCIPIKRKKDNIAHINNDDSFEACDTFLSNGGLLFIAPEGTSHNERHVRAFRPGTAKIALSAEAKNNFQLGITICCFGVTYEKPWRFRSAAYVRAAAPIKVADYREQYEKNPDAAIDALTQVIENQTRTITVDASDVKQDHLLGKVEQLIESNFWEEKGRALSPSERFSTAQKTVKTMQQLQANAPETYTFFENTIQQYFNLLKQNRLTEKAVATTKGSWFVTILLAIVNFPFFLVGFLCNILPYTIVELIWRKLRLEAYEATVRICSGVLVFPFCYWLSIRFLADWIHLPFLGVLFWTLAIFLGIFAWNYIEFLQFDMARFRLRFLKKDVLQTIKTQRQNALEALKIMSSTNSNSF